MKPSVFVRRAGIAAMMLASVAAGQAPPGVSLRIENETVPPGGIAQIQVVLTEPKPITIGAMRMRALSTTAFTSLRGVALFSAQGDVCGTATLSGGALQVAFASPSGSYGLIPGYPIMVVKFGVRPDVPVGTSFPIFLDPAASWWADLAGTPYPAEMKPGLFTVGGSLSISNVVPGGGIVPAGSTISVTGSGFEPGSQLRIENVQLASTVFLGPTLMQATLAANVRIDGKRVRIQNPDGSTDTYYPYLRAADLGRSGRPLLAATEPAFSLQRYSDATISPATTGVFGGASYITGLAIQNPGAASISITIQVFSPDNQQAGQAALTLPPRTRILREITELAPSLPPQQGGYVRVLSSSPVRLLGIAGEEVAGAVAPIVPAAVVTP